MPVVRRAARNRNARERRRTVGCKTPLALCSIITNGFGVNLHHFFYEESSADAAQEGSLSKWTHNSIRMGALRGCTIPRGIRWSCGSQRGRAELGPVPGRLSHPLALGPGNGWLGLRINMPET